MLFQAIPRHGPGVNLCQQAFLVGRLNVDLVLESTGVFCCGHGENCHGLVH